MRSAYTLLALLLLSACGDDPSSESAASTPGGILAALGAQGRAGRSADQLEAYQQTFGFLDTDANGLLTVEEYVENSIFPNPTSARGVFAATDRDGSGHVTVEEYVDNRIITDEANEIFFSLDTNGDGRVTREELGAGSSLEGASLDDAFERLDTTPDGGIGQIEFLLTWGTWARLPEVDLAHT